MKRYEAPPFYLVADGIALAYDDELDFYFAAPVDHITGLITWESSYELDIDQDDEDEVEYYAWMCCYLNTAARLTVEHKQGVFFK